MKKIKDKLEIKTKTTQTIGISFTPRGQDKDKLLNKLEELATRLKGDTCNLIHCFLNRDKVIQLGLSTDIVDKLDELFPSQINCSEITLHGVNIGRNTMVELIKSMNGKVYIIGEVRDGVGIEVNMYDEAGVEIEYIGL